MSSRRPTTYLAGFEDHRAPRCERCRHFPTRNEQRVVPGGNQRDRSHWFLDHPGPKLLHPHVHVPCSRIELLRETGVVLKGPSAVIEIPVGLIDGFAAVEAFQAGKSGFVGDQGRGDGAQDYGAFAPRRIPPRSRKGACRRLYRPLHVLVCICQHKIYHGYPTRVKCRQNTKFWHGAEHLTGSSAGPSLLPVASGMDPIGSSVAGFTTSRRRWRSVDERHCPSMNRSRVGTLVAINLWIRFSGTNHTKTKTKTNTNNQSRFTIQTVP